MYVLNAISDAALWSHGTEGGAGLDTSAVVSDGMVYVGGGQAWKMPTEKRSSNQARALVKEGPVWGSPSPVVWPTRCEERSTPAPTLTDSSYSACPPDD